MARPYHHKCDSELAYHRIGTRNTASGINNRLNSPVTRSDLWGCIWVAHIDTSICIRNYPGGRPASRYTSDKRAVSPCKFSDKGWYQEQWKVKEGGGAGRWKDEVAVTIDIHGHQPII